MLRAKKKVKKPHLIAMDLEGCLVPEIWIKLSQDTGISEFNLTTRDIKSYDKLMRKRIGLMKKHGIQYKDIEAMIAKMEPLPGARDFLDWARSWAPLIILSDTFYEFARPLIKKLNFPTLFCHTLQIAEGSICAYRLRSHRSKARSVQAFKKNGFWVTAIGDSYNDLGMLKTAHRGIFFHSPAKIREEYREFDSYPNYPQLKEGLSYILNEKEN